MEIEIFNDTENTLVSLRKLRFEKENPKSDVIINKSKEQFLAFVKNEINLLKDDFGHTEYQAKGIIVGAIYQRIFELKDLIKEKEDTSLTKTTILQMKYLKNIISVFENVCLNIYDI